MEDVIIHPTSNPDAVVAFLPQVNALVTTDFKKPPSVPKRKESGSTVKGEMAVWGDDNLFPQNAYKEAKANTIIGPTLNWKARAYYGGGIFAGRITDYTDKGEEIFKPLKPSEEPEITAFLKASNISRYHMQIASDLPWWYNAFPEMILSKTRDKIIYVNANKAMHCRWGKQNKAGRIEWCYINANWADGEDEKSPNTIKVPVIDPYYDPVTQLREGKDHKYIYELSIPSPDSVYYEVADWNAIRESGWLEVAQAIPKFKKNLMKNQMTIKYHIKVSQEWWSWKYKTWDKMSDTQRQEARDAELTKFNDFLTGEEKAGRSIMSTFEYDRMKGTMYEGWKIEAVDDKIKDGMYIEDSQEASSHILYGLGVDGTLIGNAPGKGMGAGSGSDKREAFNMFMSMNQYILDLILEPLHVARDYNGWDPDIVFRIRMPYLQTLNQVSPSQRNTTNGPTNQQ